MSCVVVCLVNIYNSDTCVPILESAHPSYIPWCASGIVDLLVWPTVVAIVTN